MELRLRLLPPFPGWGEACCCRSPADTWACCRCWLLGSGEAPVKPSGSVEGQTTLMSTAGEEACLTPGGLLLLPATASADLRLGGDEMGVAAAACCLALLISAGCSCSLGGDFALAGSPSSSGRFFGVTEFLPPPPRPPEASDCFEVSGPEEPRLLLE